MSGDSNGGGSGGGGSSGTGPASAARIGIVVAHCMESMDWLLDVQRGLRLGVLDAGQHATGGDAAAAAENARKIARTLRLELQ